MANAAKRPPRSRAEFAERPLEANPQMATAYARPMMGATEAGVMNALVGSVDEKMTRPRKKS
jgi:hypothetical protein